MSWFNWYIKSQPIKIWEHDPVTNQDSEKIIGYDRYFDKAEFEYWKEWEIKARENRGKFVKFYDDITNEELSAAEIKRLENTIDGSENYVYIPIQDEDLQVEIKPFVKSKPSKRKYKPRIPISKDLRMAVYQLFDKACRVCGNKNANQIHHIDGDASNNHIRNLELLCYDCHLATEGKVLFSRKINED